VSADRTDSSRGESRQFVAAAVSAAERYALSTTHVKAIDPIGSIAEAVQRPHSFCSVYTIPIIAAAISQKR